MLLHLAEGHHLVAEVAGTDDLPVPAGLLVLLVLLVVHQLHAALEAALAGVSLRYFIQISDLRKELSIMCVTIFLPSPLKTRMDFF